MYHQIVPLLPYAGKPRAGIAHNALSLLVRYRLRLVSFWKKLKTLPSQIQQILITNLN